MRILEEFWYGNIQPQEQDSYRIEEHRDLVKLYEYNEQLLTETLNDGQKDRLQRMKDVVEEMQDITECGAFITGFRLAVQLMAASLADLPVSNT